MHVVSPERYRNKTPATHTQKQKPLFRWLLLVLLIAGFVNYVRPLPQATVTLQLPQTPGVTQPALTWPSSGQAAVAASGYGLLGTAGAQQPLATASIAKVIAALSVLQKEPLQPGSSGPTYTIDANDVHLYQEYADQNGSVVPVTEGESLSEYQALEALMVPSANNIADSLVRWVFGSQSAYADYATSYLRAHGINQTTIGSDASGYDSSTTSTASDLTTLGLLAVQNPVLMQITSQSKVTLPVVGKVSNYNTVLGQSDIVGIKTGNNDADPGAFLFASRQKVGTQEVYITGAILGQADLDSALSAATVLSDSAQKGFQAVTLAGKGQSVGHAQTAWGKTATIRTTSSVSLVRWAATPITETHAVKVSVKTKEAGNFKAYAGHSSAATTLELDHPLAGPSFWWRLTRH